MQSIIDFECNSEYKNNIIKPLSLYHIALEEKYNNQKHSKINYIIKLKHKIANIHHKKRMNLFQNLLQLEDLSEYYYKRGLIICHGHKHSKHVIKKINFIKHWYMVDLRRKVLPDYVCNLANDTRMQYFPDKYFYCILSVYCTICSNYFDILKNVHRILSDDGIMITTEFPSVARILLSYLDILQCEKDLIEVMGIDNFAVFKNKCLNYLNKQKSIFIKKNGMNAYLKIKGNNEFDITYVIETLLFSKIRGPQKKILKKSKKILLLKWTERIMNTNGFRIIGTVGKFLVMKKIIN